MYSISELRLIWPIDDALYDLIAPNLTASATPGININTMNEATFRALVSGVTDEEVKDFFEYRDNPEADQAFKNVTDFTKYLKENISVFSSNDAKVAEFTQALANRRVQLVTDETTFKITVQAQVNQSTRTIEAWVTLLAGRGASGAAGSRQPPDARPGIPPLSGPGLTNPNLNSAGIQVTFMRFL
jgi:type II secretory pathway component PulK